VQEEFVVDVTGFNRSDTNNRIEFSGKPKLDGSDVWIKLGFS